MEEVALAAVLDDGPSRPPQDMARNLQHLDRDALFLTAVGGVP
jgi:hypothetical protein